MMLLKKICLIDDDDIVVLLVSGLLKRMREKVDHFFSYSNGKEAFAGLTQLPQVSFPDLILLDLKMPIMDGHDFLKLYSESFLSLYPNTKVVILTSSMMKQDQWNCSQYSFLSGYLVKPLLLTQLTELLEQGSLLQ
jgi:CheY-like chemotaxis protein